jgi:hypothetical protein
LQTDGDLLENLHIPTADEQKDLSQYITHRVQRTIQASKRQEKSEKELEALEWMWMAMPTVALPYSTPPPVQEMERLAEGVARLNQMVRVSPNDGLANFITKAAKIFIKIWATSSVVLEGGSWQFLQQRMNDNLPRMAGRYNLPLPDNFPFAYASQTAFQIQNSNDIPYAPPDIVRQVEALQAATVAEGVDEMLLDNALDDDVFYEADEYAPPEAEEPDDIFYDAIEYEPPEASNSVAVVAQAAPVIGRGGLGDLDRLIVRGELTIPRRSRPEPDTFGDIIRIEGATKFWRAKGYRLSNL